MMNHVKQYFKAIFEEYGKVLEMETRTWHF